MIIELVLISLIGLLLGSFINAFVWRLNVGKTVVNDRSECIHCGHKLGVKDLVPVVSWIYLKGKCRYCHKSISVQYPLVELSTALLLLYSYVFWPSTLTSYLIWGVVLVIVISMALYDLKWLILPDKLTLPLSLVAMYGVVAGFFPFSGSRESAVVAFLVFGGLFYSLYILTKGKAFGGGDVKLIFIIGLLLGLSHTAVALLLAFNIGAIAGLGLMVFSDKGRKSMIPFGPFLILGFYLSAIHGQAFIDWYLNLINYPVL